MTTPLQVAQWMVAELEQAGTLKQANAVATIKQTFGNEFVYRNDSGGLSIQRAVLLEFRRLTRDIAVWVGAEKLWRKRLAIDGEQRSGMSIRRMRHQCSRCGRPLAESQSNWRTVQLGDEHAGNKRREIRLCQECADEVDSLHRETPPDYIPYGGYWIFEERFRCQHGDYWEFGDQLRHHDLHLQKVEYVVIDPITRQEVDRCQSLQDARDSIDELRDVYTAEEDEQ